MKFPRFDNVAAISDTQEMADTADQNDNVLATVLAALHHIERLNERLLAQLVRHHGLQVEHARLKGASEARDRERSALLESVERFEERLHAEQEKRLNLAEELVRTRLHLKDREGYLTRLEEALQQTRNKLRLARRSWFERIFAEKKE